MSRSEKFDVVGEFPEIMMTRLPSDVVERGAVVSVGWQHLIKRLLYALVRYQSKTGQRVEVEQVSAYHGDLVIIVDKHHPDVNHIVMGARTVARNTCELCGDVGRYRNRRRLYKIMCDDCFDAFFYHRPPGDDEDD